jgi:hypothetical protein
MKIVRDSSAFVFMSEHRSVDEVSVNGIFYEELALAVHIVTDPAAGH